ncbi:TonB-dependent receptor domain-containing protein [Zobellella iuensis]|uniref:TonB-dependent receptor n=1 Tax=Zobellella iuensis TaxID=2803811 RepID=A0ABS1QW56_9GAMM|nr:TonB-dependent receptor [Zobellella iuensis]
MFCSNHKPSLLALTIAGIVSTPLAANDIITLDTVNVTDSRTAPDTDILIGQETLEKTQATDVADIFSGNPEIAVGGGSSPVTQKIYIRGLEDTLLNVSVDGATQSGNLFHHQGRLSIAPELLKQVEVSAGAGEATNGPGALAGAIRFVTKDPVDLLRPGQRVGALLQAGYFSNSDGYRTSGSVYGHLTDDWSALVTLSKTELGDYKDGDGNTQPFTESDVLTGFAKVVGQLTDEQKLTLSYERNQDEAFRKHRPHWVPSVRNPVFDQEMTRETVTGKYGFNAASNELVDLELTLHHTEASLEHIEGPYGTVLGSQESYGADLRNTSKLGAHSLTYGVDHRHDEGKLIVADTARETGRVTGLYLQDHFQATDRLMLSAGARYDWYELDEEFTGNSFSESGFSPNLGFSLDVTDKLNLHGGWARAMRGTQIKELFVLDYYTNAADRKKETADNYELGLSYRNGGLHMSAEAFVTEIDDVVGQVSRAVLGNVGDLKTKGFSAGIGYDWSLVSASLKYSQSRPELDGEPLSDDDWSLGTSVGDTWVAGLDFHPVDSLDLGWTGTFRERLTRVADGYTEKSGYGVHDLYARWRPLAGDQLTLAVTVQNLFDRQYQDHASYAVYGAVAAGLPEAGRDIRLSASYKF